MFIFFGMNHPTTFPMLRRGDIEEEEEEEDEDEVRDLDRYGTVPTPKSLETCRINYIIVADTWLEPAEIS